MLLCARVTPFLSFGSDAAAAQALLLLFLSAFIFVLIAIKLRWLSVVDTPLLGSARRSLRFLLDHRLGISHEAVH